MTNNLNVEHEVTLTEGQISVILYHLECKDGEEIDTIFEVLEGTVDNYYSKLEKAKCKQPVPEWD